MSQCLTDSLDSPFTAHPKIDCEDKLKDVQTLKAGSTLILLANISGVPTPDVAWFRAGEPLTTTEGTTIETTETFSTLTVKNTSSAGAGAYKITAENVVGTAEQEFNVVIKGTVC